MKGLKYLADMHISPVTCALLREAGHQVARVSDVLSYDASDQQILEYARTQQMVIITQDLDFSALLAVANASGPSVISLRLGTVEPRAVATLLLHILPTVEAELVKGAIISVTEQKLRVRLLPVH
ncbi:MAG: DUF5615 family PIN-like protein [Bacillota bacterium]